MRRERLGRQRIAQLFPRNYRAGVAICANGHTIAGNLLSKWRSRCNGLAKTLPGASRSLALERKQKRSRRLQLAACCRRQGSKLEIPVYRSARILRTPRTRCTGPREGPWMGKCGNAKEVG